MKRRRAQAADESDQARNLSDKITPSNAKRAIAVGKVLAPVLLPIAMRAAGAARGAWDDRRARRLGVAPSALTSYSGKGGAQMLISRSMQKVTRPVFACTLHQRLK